MISASPEPVRPGIESGWNRTRVYYAPVLHKMTAFQRYHLEDDRFAEIRFIWKKRCEPTVVLRYDSG